MPTPYRTVKRVAITGYLIWGLFTLWAYTAWRLPRALGLPSRTANIFTALFALAATSVYAAFTVFIYLMVASPWFAACYLSAASGFYYLTVSGFTIWLHRSLHQREISNDRDNADAVERWEQTDMRLTLFLVVSIPLISTPALSAWRYYIGIPGVQESWLLYGGTFLAGVIFHSWGTRLLISLTNDHLARLDRQPESLAEPDDLNGNSAYDIFISYRRDGGAETARLIRMAMQARKFRVFLDVDDLSSGHFDDRLLQVIENTKNMVVILSPDALERASNPKDWLRREVEHGIKTDCNLIPLLLPGFEFDTRPSALAELNRHNAVVYNHAYFDAVIDKLVSHCVS